MFFAFICLIPIALWTKNHRFPNKKALPFVLGSGILFALDISIWNESIKLSNPTQSTVIGNLAPIWIGIALFLFFANKPRKEFWIGTLIAMLGLFIFMDSEMFLQLKFDLGFVLAFISSFIYAAYMLVSKKGLEKMPIIQFMTYNMLVATLFLGAICLILDIPFSPYDSSTWLVFITNGLVCQLLGWISINHAIQKLPAQRVSLSLLSQSIVTGILAYFILKEEVTLQMIVGGLIILAGIGYTFMPERKGEL